MSHKEMRLIYRTTRGADSIDPHNTRGKAMTPGPRAWHALLLALGILFTVACRLPSPESDERTARGGVLDLRDLSPGLHEPVRLDGEWEFFWNRFIDPARPHTGEAPVPDAFAKVPGSWNGMKVLNTALEGTGFGSFRLRVLLPQGVRDPLALELKEMGTAYALFVDGVRLGGRGSPGRTSGESRPSLRPGTYLFAPGSPDIEIVIHVSNFHYRKGGIWHPIEIGSASSLSENNLRHVIAETALTGALLIIGIYYLIVSAMGRGERSPVFFGILCINMGLRQLILGHKPFFLLFPSVSFQVNLTFEYLTFGLLVPLFAEYFASLFPRRFPRRYVRALWALFGAFAAVVLLTGPVFFTKLVFVYYAHILVFCAYALYAVSAAARKGNPDARLVLWPGIVVILTAVNDIAYTSKLIDTANLLGAGIVVFILSQALLIATRFSRAFARTEDLSAELASKNTSLEGVNLELTSLKSDLEDKVRERTADLELARARAESANRAKSTFLANVSHEIRTPLNVVLGFSQLLESREGALAPQELEWIGHIRSAGENLLSTVNDILDIARVEAGKLALSMASVDIGGLLAECVDSIRPLALAKRLAIRAQVPGDCGTVRGDAARLRQVFNNLFSNAIKFTDEGKEIGVTAGKGEAQVTIMVWDRGPGIPPEDHTRIFHAFEQAYSPGAGKPQGAGLGLAIARTLAEIHGGTITVESIPGEGSSFILTLPLATERDAHVPVRGGARDFGTEGAALSGRVLVVEDNDAILRLYRSIFERTGLDAVFAINGEDGVREAVGGGFDLILMDVQLPGMDGIAAARQIRVSLGARTPPIIALTAHAMEGDRDHFISAGFIDHISKPFRIEDLMGKLAGIIGRRGIGGD
jgi:two-component system, sensor histidine kinase